MSAVYAATSNYEEVHGPRLAQVAVGKEASFAMLSVTADSQLGMRDIEGFGDNPSPFLERNSPDRQLLSPSKL